MADFDLAIIGGGINGTGLARDAAGRGLRVLLVEMNDLASGTSSASSKLIHGGLRYLEHGAFRLVREALSEREVLLRMAPHVIRPLRFMLPPLPGLRSPLHAAARAVPLRLAGRAQAAARQPHHRSHPSSGRPAAASGRSATASNIPTAWSTIPAWSCSTRSTPPSAAPTSAPARSCTRAERRDDWELVLNTRGRREVATARVLVNAAGPWIGEVADTVIRQPLPAPVRLIKGSHIVVRRRFEQDCGYMLQAPTGAWCSRCRSPTTSR